MNLRGDDRAVTVQVGVVLLFAILVIAMAVYQSTAIPTQNQQVEFDHSQRVQHDMHQMRDALLTAGVSGTARPVTVTTSVSYPAHVFFVNPPRPVSTVSTGRPSSLAIENATAAGETGDYWDGSRREFSTRELVYEPDYHEYQNAPRTVYESTVLYNRFGDGAAPLTDQRLVDGRTISLTAVDGTLSKSRAGSLSLDPRAVSAGTDAITVTNGTDGNVTVAVPTRLPEEQWASLLADQTVENGGHVVDIAYETGSPYNVLTLELEGGVVYDLRMAKVAVGSHASDTDAHYIVDVEGDDRSVYEETNRTLVVEVRDRYNNPVSGVPVDAAVTEGSGTLADGRATTDGAGRATFTYAADAVAQDEDVEVEASFGANDAERERAVFNLTIEDIQPGQGNGGGQGGTGGSSGDPDSPVIDWRLDDLSLSNENAVEYVASYDVSNTNSSFERVSIAFNDQESTAQGVENGDGVRGSAEFTSSYGGGNEWEVTLKVIYSDDGNEYVAASRQFNDEADAINPDSNADLSESSSPTVAQYQMTDDSVNNVEYTIDYTVGAPDSFDHARGVLVSLDANSGGKDDRGSTRSSHTFALDTYGTNDRFAVKLLIYDDDGVVVRYEVWTEIADGEGSYPNS